MNTTRRHSLAAVAAVALAGLAGLAAPAFAQEATYELPQPAVSAKTRAEVHAEVLQARRDGTLLATEADFQRQPTFVAVRSRAAVIAEVRADGGASHALAGEPHGFDAPQPLARLPQARLVAASR
jgi:hypothetical protein